MRGFFVATTAPVGEDEGALLWLAVAAFLLLPVSSFSSPPSLVAVVVEAAGRFAAFAEVGAEPRLLMPSRCCAPPAFSAVLGFPFSAEAAAVVLSPRFRPFLPVVDRQEEAAALLLRGVFLPLTGASAPPLPPPSSTLSSRHTRLQAGSAEAAPSSSSPPISSSTSFMMAATAAAAVESATDLEHAVRCSFMMAATGRVLVNVSGCGKDRFVGVPPVASSGASASSTCARTCASTDVKANKCGPSTNALTCDRSFDGQLSPA
mmetsp:Transcript_34637/g.70745  ORF Transcript_34637/g.70745 Transcript_34637/m.70745 type:complete len:262 (-) Transcript_34637:148-933(-)